MQDIISINIQIDPKTDCFQFAVLVGPDGSGKVAAYVAAPGHNFVDRLTGGSAREVLKHADEITSKTASHGTKLTRATAEKLFGVAAYNYRE